MRSDVKAILNASIVRQSVLFEKLKKNGINIFTPWSWPAHDHVFARRYCFYCWTLDIHVLNVFRFFMHAWSAVCPPLRSESLIHECIGFRGFFSRLTLSDFSVFFLRSSLSRSRVFSILFETFGDWWWRGGKQVLAYESGAFITVIESNSCVSLTFFHLVS